MNWQGSCPGAPVAAGRGLEYEISMAATPRLR
jgi:hypothetical protein